MVAGPGKGTRDSIDRWLWGPAGEEKCLPMLCIAAGDYGRCLQVAIEEGLEALFPKK